MLSPTRNPAGNIKNELIVIIPAKDEAQTIEYIIRRLLSEMDATILVVDDMSSDPTAQIARKAGATVISLPLHLGAWGAIRTGLLYAKQHQFNYAITMDADGQHPVSQIPLLIQTAHSGFDTVIGSCLERGNPSRRLAWYLFRLITGLTVRDLTSGFRIYNRASISVLTDDATTLFDYQDIGVLLLLKNSGLTLGEVDVFMRTRTVGVSRIFSNWRDVFRYLAVTWILSITKFKR